MGVVFCAWTGQISTVLAALVPIIHGICIWEDRNMLEIASTAQRLRTVREAQRHFLGMWAAQCLADKSLDRMSTDLEHLQADDDPFDHDWSRLYRGSVLDD
jgi:hypothetical protein